MKNKKLLIIILCCLVVGLCLFGFINFKNNNNNNNNNNDSETIQIDSHVEDLPDDEINKELNEQAIDPSYYEDGAIGVGLIVR